MLLLFFIFVRDITFASTMALSKSITQYNEIYLLLFYFLQVIASPLQASFSDHSYRRKSLVFAFSIIFVGHLFLFISLKVGVLFLLICFVLNGFFGNVLPIAIASLMDMDYLKNTKKLISNQSKFGPGKNLSSRKWIKKNSKTFYPIFMQKLVKNS